MNSSLREKKLCRRGAATKSLSYRLWYFISKLQLIGRTSHRLEIWKRFIQGSVISTDLVAYRVILRLIGGETPISCQHKLNKPEKTVTVRFY